MPQLVKPRALPVRVRQMLKAQCDGEWDRVTVDDEGAFTVHNNAAQARRFAGLNGSAPAVAPPAPKKPAAAKPTPPKKKTGPKPAPPKKAPNPQLVALASLIGSEVSHPKPGVKVVTYEKETAEDDRIWGESVGEPNWAEMDVAKTATRMRDLCANGLPDYIKFSIKPDVLAMHGVDFDLMEDSIRQPERVEIRPETMNKDKGYPILSFHRGDITTILGMRLPASPAVIAVYPTSKLMPDTHRRAEPSSSGGGGARKTAGLPSTPKAAVKALKAAGATIEIDLEARSTEVTFAGQSVGKISLGDAVPKEQVRSDYQRTLRRIAAIKQREGISA